ncbi:hypothetical protein GTY38_27245 [Streptomyces sp. SID8369]|nr:hypothetical protein [Streptomyces sp. SID8369]
MAWAPASGAGPGAGPGTGRAGVGRLRRAVPLPAPSRNRGSAPGPAPQTPEGLGDGDCGWLRSKPRSSSAGGAGSTKIAGGAAPGSVPQVPEGLGARRLPVVLCRVPFLKCRRGWEMSSVVPGGPGGRTCAGTREGPPGRRALMVVRVGCGYRLRRRNVRDRPSSSKGVPYVSSASPCA